MRTAAPSGRGRPGSRREPTFALATLLAMVVLVVVSGCSSGATDAATETTVAAMSAPTTAPPPATVPGTRDYGAFDALAGWPTTTTQVWTVAGPCIVDAFHAGTPARVVMITPGAKSCGRKTVDGYDVPTRQVRTWIVIGRDRLRQTVDRSEDGGAVTEQVCTHLELPPPGGDLFPSGCTS